MPVVILSGIREHERHCWIKLKSFYFQARTYTAVITLHGLASVPVQVFVLSGSMPFGDMALPSTPGPTNYTINVI